MPACWKAVLRAYASARQGRIRAGQRRGRRKHENTRRRHPLRGPRREVDGGVDSAAPCRRRDLDADRHGGFYPDDDAGRRLRCQPTGPLCHEPDGYPPWLADSRQRTFATTKVFTLLGTYIRKHHGTRYYGKAMNIARRLTAAYDAALATHDLLADADDADQGDAVTGYGRAAQTVSSSGAQYVRQHRAFDITHHPAMAVPCGMSDGLPVSVMLIGRHFDEPTIYRAAYAFEQSGDWMKM